MKLQENSILTRIHISVFNPVRKDEKITKDVIGRNHSSHNSGQWKKNIINPDHLAGIVRQSSATRRAHDEKTLPWQDSGVRILPAKLYLEWQEEINDHKSKFDRMVSDFIYNWDTYVEEAKQNLNGMFRDRDYPTKSELERKFGIKASIFNIPDSSDFRVKMMDANGEEIKARIDTSIKEAESNIKKELFVKVLEPVKRMAEKLKNEKGIFRNTLVENLREVVEIFPKMNIVGDPVLEGFVEELKEISSANPEALRNDRRERKAVAEEAERIAKKMEAYL